MDISNLTIPPDLFYSKNPSETWKPRCLSKITPTQVRKEVAKKPLKKRKVFKKFNGPQLGRIEKVHNKFIKKKLIKKKLGVLKEIKQISNNNVVKLPTKKEETKLQKAIKAKEEEIKKRLYIDENRVVKAKRRKGSGFKFFKSKNGQEEEEKEPEESDDDLVPEIRDYTPPSSADTSRIVQKNLEKTKNFVVDPEAFEDDAEPEIDGTIIESLLQNLEETPVKQAFTLDSLIGTLEGTGSEEAEKEQKKQPKPKFMGFGDNQLQIDAGQTKFGLVECKECGFSYNVS